MAKRPVSRSSFYLYMSVAFLALALAGFSTTFFIPVVRGTFSAPAVIHVHAALVFGWLLFLILQVSLIRRRKVVAHRQLGIAGFALALGVVASGVMVGFHATRRDMAAGGDDLVLGQLVNIHIEMLLFGGLVAAAIYFRRDGESHKRLLILATISALAPAWLRLRHLLPFVPNPFVTFSLLADSLLLVGMARDLIVMRRIHPVYIWAGAGMVAVHVLEILAIRCEPWLRLSRWLLDSTAA